MTIGPGWDTPGHSIVSQLFIAVYPRPCGGAHRQWTHNTNRLGLSPPVRGSQPNQVLRGSGFGSIPARAGEPRYLGRHPNSRKVYPRPCGGALAGFRLLRPGVGLSPPVRGSPEGAALDDHVDGSIPARAGEPRPGDAPTFSRAVYPRPCGGAGHIGPSELAGQAERSIPARAGEPTAEARRLARLTVYPRPCGGAGHIGPMRAGCRGLSPPVRGSHTPVRHGLGVAGSIPARAGEPPATCGGTIRRRVYPRPCGGATCGIFLARNRGGLSPPVRGSLPPLLVAVVPRRSIPARAGEPRWDSRNRSNRRVYPRPCGGASSSGSSPPEPSGLSPPVRGSRKGPLSPVRGRWSIPARAGEPSAG